LNAGWDVMVLSRPGFPIDIKPELSEAEINLTDMVDEIPYVRTLSPKRGVMPSREYMLLAADAIEKKLREYRPAMVMAASPAHVTGLPALIAARRLGISFIYEIRGLWEITRMSRDNGFQDTAAFQIQKILEASAARLADRAFTLTEPMRDELSERGVPKEHVVLLPNACDPNRFRPMNKDKELLQKLGISDNVAVIGYVGTFVDYEGLEDLAEACGLLKQRGTEFRLLLVGNEDASGQARGPISERIVQIAETHQFSDWLIMPGRVPHEEVEKYYSLIDIAPFPRKPWPVCEMVSPMKPLEALAMEKPVVVSSVRALVEMIKDEETGLVFQKADTQALANTLNRLIQSKDLRKSIGEQGRKWIKKERTWDLIGEKATNEFALLLQNRSN
jgi:glycosyltransferase involved in cell wall biosynthesis